ncbi:probable serine/threonine-protein kinase ndrD [Drosophila sulfurigaster albostrigata]|uniref:probable serine/threonine-protein kinase ndrD n=1 Tax=Drosophila sulfurigaster albostrigata TaxID=89887 RepID=UPI002D21AD36|nr:probable serine/threonine-protein kinase ndrD [Drosophila sulfurigaster albostrigata]
MAENTLTEGDKPPSEETMKKEAQDDAAAKPLKMSFADWKKCKEAEANNETECEAAATTTTGRNGRQQNQNKYDKQHSFNGNGNRNNNNNNHHHNINNNNNNGFSPMNRPPPLPFPLMSMGFSNFGPGPGPCGPPPMMPPQHGNMMGPCPGPRKNQRPMQAPPFWQDMMSPQHRSPPIQPPMPKCPSLWNLVPKDKGNNNNAQRQGNNNKNKQQNQPNKKYKTNNTPNSTSKDAALMPPPPVPGTTAGNSNSNSTTSNQNTASPAKAVVKKKKNGGTFVQIDGKWIQRPEAPPPLEEAPPGTKEDRQRQWREYRQAMKPFKNREFHNWKRTVQRLSKLPRNELDERQLERLQKAEDYIGAHKAMLTVKHAEHWVQQNTHKTDATGGQVYVRKQAVTSWERKDNPNTFHRGVLPMRNKQQTFGTGRAIKGGIGGELTTTTSGTTGQPAGIIGAPPPPPPIGQFPDITAGYFGQSQGYNSNVYGGQDVAITAAGSGSSSGNNGSSNPFYASYNTNFVKGGTLLPP